MIFTFRNNRNFLKNIIIIIVKNCIENLWYLGDKLNMNVSLNGSVPPNLELGGTPLNEAIICLHKLIPQFKRQNSLSKVNVITLTDGCSNWMLYNSDERSKYNPEVLYRKRIRTNFCLRDRKTGMVYRGVDERFSNTSLTTILIEDLKFKFPEVNLIGFRIVSMGEFSSFLSYVDPLSPWGNNREEYKKQMKKYNSFSFTKNVGYDMLFTILSNMMKDEDEICLDTADEDVDIKTVASQFRKKMKSKANNKKMLSQFAELVS